MEKIESETRIRHRSSSSIPAPKNFRSPEPLIAMGPLLEDITERMGIGISLRDREEDVFVSSRFSRLLQETTDLIEDTITIQFHDRETLIVRLISPNDHDDKIISLAKMAIVGEVSVGLAHDFRNILTVIQANLEYINLELNSGKRLGKGAEGAVRDIEAAIEVAKELCNRTERLGSKKNIIENSDVKQLVESGLRMARTRIEKAREDGRNIEVENQITENLWAKMVFAEVQMAFLNILFNGLRYCGMQGKKGRIVVDSFPSAGRVILSVYNNGPPIPEEIQGSLLQKPLASFCVNGYGLFTAAQNLGAFGGEISFTSGLDGTTFLISLPATIPPQ